jgi:serine/threonine-protein phosphatase 2B regulatory subunit
VHSDGSGSIDREEFLQIPQIATNPLASRMIAIFDEECVPAPGPLVSDAGVLTACGAAQWRRHRRLPGVRRRPERVQLARRARGEAALCVRARAFSGRAALTRAPVAFKVYDMDRDGFISNGELFLVLKMMVRLRLPPTHFPRARGPRPAPEGAAADARARRWATT